MISFEWTISFNGFSNNRRKYSGDRYFSKWSEFESECKICKYQKNTNKPSGFLLSNNHLKLLSVALSLIICRNWNKLSGYTYTKGWGYWLHCLPSRHCKYQLQKLLVSGFSLYEAFYNYYREYSIGIPILNMKKIDENETTKKFVFFLFEILFLFNFIFVF